MSFDSVTVTTTATKIIDANVNRISLILTNISPGTVYIGQDSTVTVSNGVPLSEGDKLTEDNGGTRMYLGQFYAIVAAGTSDIRFWERTVKR